MIEHKGSIGHIRAPKFLHFFTSNHTSSPETDMRARRRKDAFFIMYSKRSTKKYANASRLKQHRAVRIIPPRSGRIHNRPQRNVFEHRVLLLLTLKTGYKQPRGPLSESASCIEDTIAVNNLETRVHKRREYSLPL